MTPGSSPRWSGPSAGHVTAEDLGVPREVPTVGEAGNRKVPVADRDTLLGSERGGTRHPYRGRAIRPSMTRDGTQGRLKAGALVVLVAAFSLIGGLFPVEAAAHPAPGAFGSTRGGVEVPSGP